MNKRQIGTQHEAQAVQYLKDNGYEILERNYRCKQGEIDIIAKKDGVVVYVEVRYRSTNRYGEAVETVNLQKQKRVCRAAMWHYTRMFPEGNAACRFDVIGINGAGALTHIENAFPFVR